MRGLALGAGVLGATVAGVGVYLVAHRSSTAGTAASGASGSTTATASGDGVSSGTGGSGSSTPGPNTGTPSTTGGTTVVPKSASPGARLAALKQSGSVVLQGLSGAEAGFLKTVIVRHGSAITGVTAGGAVILNLRAPHAAQVSLLATQISIVIPGASATDTRRYENLAAAGKLVGISLAGQPLY